MEGGIRRWMGGECWGAASLAHLRFMQNAGTIAINHGNHRNKVLEIITYLMKMMKR